MLKTPLKLLLIVLATVTHLKPLLGVETVVILDRGEPYGAMTAEKGVFWIGQSRRNFNSDYRLEVYRPDGQLVDSVRLAHSLNQIKKAGNGSVVVTGINPVSQLTQYTFATFENDRIQFKTTQINVDGFISFWVGTLGKRHFFADIGGNPNDSQLNLDLPAQTLFSSASSAPTYLKARVRMPLAGEIIDGKLMIVSSEGMSLKAGSIVEVDPLTSSTKILLDSKTAQFRGIEAIPGTALLLTLAAGENKLLLIDKNTGEIKREFPTTGYSRVFNRFGHCAIVGNDESNTIEVFQLNSDVNQPVLTEKISLSADEFSGIKQIASDELTGTIFVRANFPCNPLIEVCNKDFNRVVSLGQNIATKLKNRCF